MIFRNKKNNGRKYKFRDLKVYASTEWLAEGKKKYRKVFENSEATYLYAELSFYNKLFDDEEWDADIRLKCFRFVETGKEELCDLDIHQKVSVDHNIIYIREGWGHEEPGYFWKRGDYLWEAYIDEEFVGSTRFYVEDGGPVSQNFNPYFDIDTIKLYEGSNEGVRPEDRTFLKKFNASDTRYIWAEFILDNLQDRPWFCELIFNFYNEAGLLKGTTAELKQIKSEEDTITIITGWGSDSKGTWYEDKYTLEVIFMDRLIAVVPFECGTENVPGAVQILTGEETSLKTAPEPEEIQEVESLESIMDQLKELVGLKDIKNKINDYLEYLEFLKLRKEKGFDENERINLHSVFTGNPGTGKTTIAKLLGKIYHKMGFLSRGNITEVGRAELIGQYIGQTAPKVKDVIESARGGVLFIDEAYALVRNEEDDKDYGHEVVEVLVKEMSDGEGDIAIFVAGYPKEMDVFLNSNPGLKSRFNMFYDFPDYLPQELISIADLIVKKREVVLTPKARKFLDKKLTDFYRNRDRSFGNARLVASIVDEAKMSMGLRVMRDRHLSEVTNEMLQTIELQDLQKVFKEKKQGTPKIGIDEASLTEALSELNTLVGLRSVKNEIHELVKLVKFYLETGKDVLNKFSLHTVFKGNPGTGKTTVARVLAKIYKALGILERGHLVECSRQELVAGFVGQTAIKTKELIDRAHGGVLFIDEAYSLFSSHGGHDYGKEAIEVLLKEMEDKRGEFIVVVAGYTEPMEKFLEMNPGFKSRFDKELFFEDFTEKELYDICTYMLSEEELVLDTKAEKHLQDYLKFLFMHRDKFFGNGRAMRKIVSKTVKNQHLRMASLKPEERSEQMLQEVTYEDIKEFDNNREELLRSQKTIGFKIY
ncbi:AAA family ATPase [Rapidithrix thailandica]|uniref:AAA family ATPase n=1 Tax=Rapidithrix thailandica TaxID=413964 RepID=A0AAW9S2L8_9BACT